MKRILPNRRHVQFEVTDDRLTSRGGLAFLKATADRLGVFKTLDSFLPCKKRQCGASDIENPWSLIASLSNSDGALQGQDRLSTDNASQELLGLKCMNGR